MPAGPPVTANRYQLPCGCIYRIQGHLWGIFHTRGVLACPAHRDTGVGHGTTRATTEELDARTIDREELPHLPDFVAGYPRLYRRE